MRHWSGRYVIGLDGIPAMLGMRSMACDLEVVEGVRRRVWVVNCDYMNNDERVAGAWYWMGDRVVEEQT